MSETKLPIDEQLTIIAEVLTDIQKKKIKDNQAQRNLGVIDKA